LFAPKWGEATTQKLWNREFWISSDTEGCAHLINSDFRKDWQQVDGPRISKLSFKANVSRAFEGGFSDKAPERLCFICWKGLARGFILRGE
jgi:hypothetical protein